MAAIPNGRPVRIFVAGVLGLLRRGFVQFLSDVPDIEVVGDSATAAEALELLPRCAPEVMVIDESLLERAHPELCAVLRSRLPGVRCLIMAYGENQDATVAAALAAGASGYLPWSASLPEFVHAVRQIARGRSLIDTAVIEKAIGRARDAADVRERLAVLTSRERELLDLIADGLTNREIGKRMELSETTVKNYVSVVLRKLDLQRRTQAAVVAAEARAASSAAPPPEPAGDGNPIGAAADRNGSQV